MASSDSRRSFLKAVVTAGSAAVGALIAVPGVAYLVDPLLRAKQAAGGWRKLTSLDTLSEAPRAVSVIGDKVDAWTKAPKQHLGTVWLRKTGDDAQVQALSAACPHLGCTIKYEEKQKQYTCPCHDSAFTLSGKVKYGPSPRSMDPLDVRVRDGQVEVRFVRFRSQSKERIEIG